MSYIQTLFIGIFSVTKTKYKNLIIYATIKEINF